MAAQAAAQAAVAVAQAVMGTVIAMENAIITNLSFTDFDLKLKDYAAKNSVPIIFDEGLAFLETVIKLHRPKRILEIGTAIAYSAIRMNRCVGSEIYTIERNEVMYNEAIKNIKEAQKENEIHVIFKDALEAFDNVKDLEFDMIFIDAAKAQYTKFFDLYSPLLSERGIVVCDNMLFHGLVMDDEHYMSYSRSVRGLIRKLHHFHEELINNNNYETTIFPIGDGMSVSIKK